MGRKTLIVKAEEEEEELREEDGRDIVYVMWYNGDKRMGTLISKAKLKKWWKDYNDKINFTYLEISKKVDIILREGKVEEWLITDEGKTFKDEWARRSCLDYFDKVKNILDRILA